MHSLNILINARESLVSRHAKFVDKYMAASSKDPETKFVFNDIQKSSPLPQIPITPIDDVHSAVDFARGFVAPQPTRTQLRRCKRAIPLSSSGVLAAPASVSPPLTIFPITVEPQTRHLQFWISKLDTLSQLHWSDLCEVLKGIGYTIYEPKNGAARRFEGPPGSIVFHQPHGSKKVAKTFVRSQWRLRLRRHF